MNNVLKQQFEAQMEYLPEINQRALKSFDWATKLLDIGHRYGLHIDELDELQVETMLVLVGLTQPENYQDELITRLAISPSEAGKLIDDINKGVFMPIHDYILAGGEKKLDVTSTTPTDIMQSAGIAITTDETPIEIKTPLVRAGGSTPMSQSIPETRPVASPLQFHPNPEKSVSPETPVAQTTPGAETFVNNPIQLSKEKLEKMYYDRQKTVDAALGTNTETQ